MNAELEAAIEQLRWQFEHAPNNTVPHGACCAIGQDIERAAPDVLILFAWGDAAAFFVELLKQHGFGMGGEHVRMFPPKPNPN